MIGTLISGMHMGSHIELPKWIGHHHTVGTKDPASAMVVLIVGRDGPASLSRNQLLIGLHDTSNNLPRQKLSILRIDSTTETRHRRRRRMRMGRRDQHAMRWNFCELRGLLFCIIQHRTSQHQTVNNDDRDLLCTVVKHKSSTHECIMSFLSCSFFHHPVDDHRKDCRSNVDHGRAGTEDSRLRLLRVDGRKRCC